MKKDRPEVWDAKTEIISLYEKGYTTLEIGEQFNTSNHTINKILKINNITLRKRGTKIKNIKYEITINKNR
jgi:intein-encoded DNA endonuclease-like protein